MIGRIARRGWRQLSLLVAVLLVFSYLAENLLRMQVLHSAEADATMQGYYAQDVAAPQIQKPPRGMVIDDNGRPLVSTVTVYKLAASPPYVKKKALTARTITDMLFPLRLPGGKLAHDEKAIAKAHTDYRAHYQQILRQLSRTISYVCLAGDDSPNCTAPFDISQQVKDLLTTHLAKLGLSGITTEPRYQPIYPNASLAAQDLGFVTYQYVNGQWIDAGQYGVQEHYDTLLSGVPGHVSVRVDTSGLQMRVGTGADAAPQQGATLRLTLDGYIQYVVEHVLSQVVHDHHALSGSIVVERPSDGAILAMASMPTYDPNNWRQIANKKNKQGKPDPSSLGVFVNPAISGLYEPGSTFKPIMVASGLDSHSFTQWTPVADNGTVQVGGYAVQNWCGDSCSFLTPHEDVRTMLKYSSNVGAVKFSRQIPAPTFYTYLDGFGFGKSTGIDLAGESPGMLLTPDEKPPAPVWVPAYKDSTAYGQGGISVTALQLTNAYAALANGGMLPHPHLLQSYTMNGKTITPSWPLLHRVISQDTSDLIKQIMVDSGIGGEACSALLPGWDVAAKTGTAYLSNGNGTYATDRTIASTIAFAPVHDPQFVVLVEVHMADAELGSMVAAPAVHQILQALFDYYKVPPPAQPPTQPTKLCAGPLQP